MPRTLHTPHDILLKDLLQNKSQAIAFFEKFLDPKIIQLIDFETLETQDTTFITSKLKKKISDFVFRVQLKNDKSLYLSILIEHKSSPDKYTSLQIIRYIAEAHEKQLKENKKLELIIPVLFYHGNAIWKYQSIKDLLSHYPKSLLSFVPDFEVFKIYLNTYSHKELAQIREAYLSACMLIMNSDKKENYTKNLREILKRLENFGNGEQILKIIRYFYSVSDVEIDQIQEILEDLPTQININIMTLEKQLIEKGRKAGIEEGIENRDTNFIINSFKNKLSISLICNITNLSETKVNQVLKNNGLI